MLLPKYSDVDSRSVKKDPNPTSWYGDPRKENSYFGANIDKHERAIETQNLGVDPPVEILGSPKILNCLEFSTMKHPAPLSQVILFLWTILQDHLVYTSPTQS